jgi:hypothetical protein
MRLGKHRARVGAVEISRPINRGNNCGGNHGAIFWRQH